MIVGGYTIQYYWGLSHSIVENRINQTIQRDDRAYLTPPPWFVGSPIHRTSHQDKPSDTFILQINFSVQRDVRFRNAN